MVNSVAMREGCSQHIIQTDEPMPAPSASRACLSAVMNIRDTLWL
ncbi:hypothetical protein [Epibacterium sp. MM17-32]|nr:hypothetical protein [Epibacterium sp. MM17-32]